MPVNQKISARSVLILADSCFYDRGILQGRESSRHVRSDPFPHHRRNNPGLRVRIDSLPVPLERRREVWGRIVQAISPDVLNKMVQVAALVEMPTLAHEILHGQIRGRVVVDVNA